VSSDAQQGISVIVPAYNCEATLAATLDSLLAQTHREWEAIVVDDGSGDRTAEIAEGYRRRDARVRLHRQANKGVGGARNAGIALAGHPWMFFLDADDTVLPDAFEKLLAATSGHPGADAVLGGCRRVDAAGRKLRSQIPGHHQDHFAVFARICAIVIHSCLVKTELVRRAGGFDEALVTCEDWDLWQRIARVGARFATIDADVAIYRMSPGTASHDGRRMLHDGLLVIERGHGVDDRTLGLEAEDLKLPSAQARNVARTYFACYAAGLEMAMGRDARWVVEALGTGIASVDPDGVAETLCLALADGLVAPPGEWSRFPPEAHRRCREFLGALGDRLGDHWLAFGAQNALERMALRGERGRRSARAGRWQLVEVDAGRPLGADIEVEPGVELALLVVRFGEDEIGDLEVSLPDGGLDRRLIADAVAARYAWELLERFLDREVRPQLEVLHEGASARVLRDGRLLFEGELGGDRPRHLALHDEIGWTLFLQELWGVRSLVGGDFYEPEPEVEEIAEPVEAPGELVEVDLAEPLPALRRSDGRPIDLALSVAGAPLTAIRCATSGDRLSAHRLRREILVQCGFELCRAVLREALLLAPEGAGGSLRERLVTALAARRAGRPLLPPAANVVGRGAGRDGTSASRWFALPRTALDQRLALAKRDGDPISGPATDGPLFSAPLVLDRVRRPSSGLSDESIWRSLEFERTFGREVDPWRLEAPYEQHKYRLTLKMVPARVGHALELGCAEGHFTEKLAKKVRKLTAADLSFIALSRARKRCARRRNVEFAQVDVFEGELEGAYDLVVCSELLYYAGTSEALDRGLRGIGRALRPGGHVLTAHAHTLVDDPTSAGFDWDVPFGAASIEAAFRETEMFELCEEARTEAYRVQLWRRTGQERRRWRPRRRPRLRRVEAAEPSGMREFRPHGGEVNRQPAQQPEGAMSFPILMYHRIAPDGAEATARWRLHPDAFEEQLSHLRRQGYTSIDFEQWRVASDRRYPIPPSSVMITFDDGYADFVDYAQPLLAKYDFKATVFVVSDLVGKSNRWDDARGEELELMDWKQLEGLLRAGVQIGSHSSAHRPLVSLTAAELAQDFCRSRIRFHEKLGFAVRSVCYPYGLHDAAVRSLAGACGFQYGVTTDEWHASFGEDLLMLPRLEVEGGESFDEFKSRLSG
jgi:peptidoglycan/xylan/chitin deacetylase (PgdA/CDA1 family)/SAM-dependent methyltransferase